MNTTTTRRAGSWMRDHLRHNKRIHLHRLAAFVRGHDCVQNVRIRRGAVWAHTFWSQSKRVNGEWVFSHSGRTFARIGATLNECRETLGY